MRQLVTRLSVLLIAVAMSGGTVFAQQPSPDASAKPAAEKEARSPWLLVPMFSSSPKLGTALGGLGAYMHVFDPASRVSLFGVTYRYTSTHSQIFSAFARTSSGADHHRIVLIAAFGQIKNDYEDYLGTGQPLKTDDDLKAVAGRYLFRATGDWFIGAQGSAANYQVLGATAEDDLVLETLGVRGFESTGVGAVLMHDSRDNEDMPTSGYKQGQYLSPHMSSLEVEERLSFNARWGATLFAGAAGLYGEAPVPLDRSIYPTVGAGLHFVIKPKERMSVNLEYAHGIEDNHGVYLKLGYAW